MLLTAEKQTKIKTVFTMTMVMGFIAHMYGLVNKLPIYDSLHYLKDSLNVIDSGRWFLVVPSSISSLYELPWFNGVLSLIYIALASILIIELFEVKDKRTIILMSGLMASFPAVTETFNFMFTADSYMMALLMAATAVYITRFEKMSLFRGGLAIVLLTLSLGIYQVYVSFAIVLILCYLVMQLLTKERKLSEYIHYGLKQMAILIMSGVLYFVIWKVLLFLENKKVNAYRGIDAVASGNFDIHIVATIKEIYRQVIMFFIQWNILKHGVTVYSVLNILFIFLSIMIICVFAKNRNNSEKVLLSLIVCILIPLGAFIWKFIGNTEYAFRMEYCMVIPYILVLVLGNQILNKKIKIVISILFAAIIFNYALMANINYTQMQSTYENTYRDGIAMVEEINAITNGKTRKITVLGDTWSDRLIHKSTEEIQGENFSLKSIYPLSENYVSTLLTDEKSIVNYLNDTFFMKLEIMDDGTKQKLQSKSDVKEMNCWPQEGSIKVIDDVIVLKLSE